MHRRHLILGGAAAATLAALPRHAAAAFAPTPGDWRRFELVTEITLPAGAEAQAWVPMPSFEADGWMRAGKAQWSGDAEKVEVVTSGDGAEMLHARWPAGETPRRLQVTTLSATRDRAVDLSAPGSVPPLPEGARARYTAATDLIPTDGIVRETSDRATAGAKTDLAKARAIYDWIVENTARNPETRGCGLGDIGSMLHMGDLTGKCADLNALFVGLARAAGLPARDLYGLRVAPSAFGYKSLGAGSADVTRAQHCRAEVWLQDFGWVPVDPADVRKVMLEEPPKDLPLSHPKVAAARETLFGAWEGNWIAYNDAHDVALPGAELGEVPFLMYPQAEIGGERRDPLSPDDFAYTITARDLPA
ncbi:transglutaminase-like domain-containing protein [Roseivivax sediminis]|uniref:Transglutaminase-like enzyme, putative cysteine protease n=1 Tax=Roseivivax sediminis TaxID=936889 RepID=A0A1I1VCB4_9RHOB|nr:transglutaminase domain-containing protein [Roseivivax sediminis]SFD80731.1 Transglutaminase-like enzyme, putative cysteine protease [Roseivivax sediminis]